MDEEEDAGRLRRRTTTTKRWEHSGADRQVVRRKTTTHRVYSKTTVLEEFGPTDLLNPETSALARRRVDYEAAVAVTAGVQPLTAAEAQPTYGRPGISDAELEEQAVQLRAYWARRLGKPHRKFEMRLKPMVLEFGLERMRGFIDEVAHKVPEDAEARVALELLLSRMSEARRLKGPKAGKT